MVVAAVLFVGMLACAYLAYTQQLKNPHLSEWYSVAALVCMVLFLAALWLHLIGG